MHNRAVEHNVTAFPVTMKCYTGASTTVKLLTTAAMVSV